MKEKTNQDEDIIQALKVLGSVPPRTLFYNIKKLHNGASESETSADAYLNKQRQRDVLDCVVIYRSLDEDFRDSGREELKAVLQKQKQNKRFHLKPAFPVRYEAVVDVFYVLYAGKTQESLTVSPSSL